MNNLQEEYIKLIESSRPDINKIPGGWFPGSINYIFNNENNSWKEPIINKITGQHIPNAYIINNALCQEDCNFLIDFMMSSSSFENVSIQGRKDIIDDRIGSKRTTVFSTELATRLKPIFDKYIDDLKCNDFTPTDWWQDNINNDLSKELSYNWKYLGISPMLRFMKYEKHGQHYAHYDAGFIYNKPQYRTLLSFVIYLTTNISGATRFIEDEQSHLNVWDRQHDDWTREALESEVIAASQPIRGNILVFPHRMCHDVEQYIGNEPRIIIRGDVLFKDGQN